MIHPEAEHLQIEPAKVRSAHITAWCLAAAVVVVGVAIAFWR